MLHLVFNNVLYPEINKATKIFVNTKTYKKPCILIDGLKYGDGQGNYTIRLDVCSHPHVQEILKDIPEEQLTEAQEGLVYQVFNLMCQFFTGKTYVDNKLVENTNKLLSLDAVLFSLQKKKEDDTIAQ